MPHLHFTHEEFAACKGRVLAAMERGGLDLLLMFKQESMYDLSDHPHPARADP